MKVSELYAYLEARIPSSLSCEWDHDGLACCPDPDRDVKRVLVVLDVNDAVVDLAAKENYDVILSHHPMLFHGISEMTGRDPGAAKCLKLIRMGTSVMCFHTRLDAVTGGVNDCLAALLGLRNVTSFGNEAAPIGRVGDLAAEGAPVSLDSFAELLKEKLNAPAVLVADAGRPVRRVALLGGEGKDELQAAIAAGADTFVSGRLGYHTMVDACATDPRPEQINLIEAGHFYTEQPVTSRLAELVRGADPTIAVEIENSNRIRVI